MNIPTIPNRLRAAFSTHVKTLGAGRVVRQQKSLNQEVYSGVLEAHDFSFVADSETPVARTFLLGDPGIPVHRHGNIREKFRIAGIYDLDGILVDSAEAYLVNDRLEQIRLVAGMEYEALPGTWHGFEVAGCIVHVDVLELEDFSYGDVELYRNDLASVGSGSPGNRAWSMDD